MSAAPQDPAHVAIRLLAERGFEATSVGELADAAQISRSTFFRRFGTKEDVVFADHERLVERLQAFLEASSRDLRDTVIAGARMVLDHHLQHPETSRLRWNLLRENPNLRDRELVVTRRYERAFAAHLVRTVPAGTPEWAAPALAAAVVAVHNSVLRRWLRDPALAAGPVLDRELGELLTRLGPAVEQAPAAHAEDPEAILEQISALLRRR